jgi:hypothetical protein
MSYQDQDSHQDQVVLQDQVIFQDQDKMEHPPWMQSYHGDFNLLVAIQNKLTINIIFQLQHHSNLFNTFSTYIIFRL